MTPSFSGLSGRGGVILFFHAQKIPRREIVLHPFGYIFDNKICFYTLQGIIHRKQVDNIPERVYNDITMNKIAVFIKQKRKEAGLTQEEFAIRSGLGLRFVRELEQGKETVRMDKVNQALAMFGAVAVPGRISENEKEEV